MPELTDVFQRRMMGFTIERTPVGVLRSGEKTCEDALEDNCCVSGGGSGSEPIPPEYTVTCGTTPPCYLPDRVKVTVYTDGSVDPAVDGPPVVAYATPTTNPFGASDLWDIVIDGPNWNITGSIQCDNSSDCGPFGFQGNTNGTNGLTFAITYQCGVYPNQSWTGVATPAVNATGTLYFGMFVLEVEDYGIGNPDC